MCEHYAGIIAGIYIVRASAASISFSLPSHNGFQASPSQITGVSGCSYYRIGWPYLLIVSQAPSRSQMKSSSPMLILQCHMSPLSLSLSSAIVFAWYGTRLLPLHHGTDLSSSSREVLYTKDAQPFLISGSGTLGWDQVNPYLAFGFPRSQISPQVSANLVEPGENALVLHTGYFGDSFADWCVF